MTHIKLNIALRACQKIIEEYRYNDSHILPYNLSKFSWTRREDNNIQNKEFYSDYLIGENKELTIYIRAHKYENEDSCRILIWTNKSGYDAFWIFTLYDLQKNLINYIENCIENILSTKKKAIDALIKEYNDTVKEVVEDSHVEMMLYQDYSYENRYHPPTAAPVPTVWALPFDEEE